MSVIRLTSGAISLSISSHFPIRGSSMKVKPVILPPGCDSVAAKPCPTGSLTTLKTIGMVAVARCSAAVNRRAAAYDEVRCRTHQLCRVGLDLSQVSTGVSMLDLDVAVLGPAERLETLAKCNDPSQHFGIILGVWMQESDAPHAVALLRARRERPSSRQAAEKRDELASAFHSIASSARASRVGGTVRPIALAVLRLI